MIDSVKGVRIKGRCFKEERNLVFYQNQNDRISIVYGKNGSGKSTISEAIYRISHEELIPDLSASFIDSECNVIQNVNGVKTFVFNEKYIDDNIKIDDDGLSTIVLLGAQVGLDTQIAEHTKKKDALIEENNLIVAEFEKHSDKNNPLCPDYHYSRIVALLKKDGNWADADSRIKGNKIKSQVTDVIINEIGELKVVESIEELNKQYNEKQALLSRITDGSMSFPTELKPITIDERFENNLLELLKTRISKPVLSDREKLILKTIQNGLQNRVEAAREDFSHEKTTICPYCFQPVSDLYKRELVENINRVLNKDVDDHKARLLAIVFPELDIDLTIFERLDPPLVNRAQQQLEECKKLSKSCHNYVDQKLNNIYTPIDIAPNGITKAIEELNTILEELEKKRIEFNDAIKKQSAIKNDLILINKYIAHTQIAQQYKDYKKQKQELESIKSNLKRQQELIDNEKGELSKLQRQKMDIGLAIDSINNSLDYVFLAHGRLSIELKNGKYYLKSNGEDVLPKKVSQGERNIIALCYFFTQILSNQEVGKLYQEESFVVIDDPVSSFDFENKVGINSFLRYQADRIIKGNPESKILFLSHDLETIFALRKSMEEICSSTKGVAGQRKTTYIALELNNCELGKQCKSYNEYGVLLINLFHFANEENHDSLTIGNEMRRVLEAFSTFNYKKSIEDVSCDANVKKALEEHSVFFENLMYRLVLHGESHYEEQVYSIHDGNNFYKFISDEEKIKTARHILCFMYILNPYHIMAYLQTESGSIEKIRTWLKSIPKNEDFDIIEKLPNRIIPLYFLPLSAGVGNEVFDDVDHEDYETSNIQCDFALKISGDSMTPTITDGSIVLVKKQQVLDKGEVGAFCLNGKVYCKYMSKENGKTVLCSNNEKYPPISIKDEDEFYIYGKIVEVIKT